MAARMVAARQASSVARFSFPSSQTASSLVHRRGMASGGDHHGPPKVNFWQDPMSPSKWKEEQFVLMSLAGWGLLVYGGYYGGYKYFTGSKKNDTGQNVEEPPR